VIITEPLIRVAKAARALGCTYFLLGIVLTGLLLSLSEHVRAGGGSDFAFLFVFVNLVYSIPGLSLLWLARKLEGGALWAALVIMTLSGLVLCGFLWGLAFDGANFATSAGALCGIIGLVAINIPTLMLVGVCLSAVPELRHLRRARLREAQQFTGGFPVVPSGSAATPTMASVKPPPRPNAIPRSKG
jgi:hypothetical protein